MPKYCYKCNDCNVSFEVRHSMSFTDQKCIECKSDNIFKVPQILDLKKTTNKSRVGKVVDEYIQNAKQDLKREKSDLSKREI